MSLPWVSRGRFDDALQQIAELKADKKLLTDRVAELTGQRPLYATTPVTEPQQQPQPIDEPRKPMGRKLTSRELIAEVEKLNRAGKLKRPGPVGVKSA